MEDDRSQTEAVGARAWLRGEGLWEANVGGLPRFYAKTVFFVRDASAALAFYTNALGFSLDWMHEENGKPHVFQVSLHGFELILNQIERSTVDRPGHGRAFIGLDPAGSAALRQHVASRGIETAIVQWGAPTVAIQDQDGNELFFWLPEAEHEQLAVDGVVNPG